MIEHNHITRDIKSLGKCPACDLYHGESKEVEKVLSGFLKYDSEGNYLERE